MPHWNLKLGKEFKSPVFKLWEIASPSPKERLKAKSFPPSRCSALQATNHHVNHDSCRDTTNVLGHSRNSGSFSSCLLPRLVKESEKHCSGPLLMPTLDYCLSSRSLCIQKYAAHMQLRMKIVFGCRRKGCQRVKRPKFKKSEKR